jgi:hypothetical protein
MTRAVAVLGATLPVSIALKVKEKPRIQATVDRNPLVGGCQESEREPVRKDVVAKIVRFLFLRSSENKSMKRTLFWACSHNFSIALSYIYPSWLYKYWSTVRKEYS